MAELIAFSKLRKDMNRNTWTEARNYRSPYKPLLLLSVMDLIAYGSVTKNYIQSSFDLIETLLLNRKKKEVVTCL